MSNLRVPIFRPGQDSPPPPLHLLLNSEIADFMQYKNMFLWSIIFLNDKNKVLSQCNDLTKKTLSIKCNNLEEKEYKLQIAFGAHFFSNEKN